MWGAPSDERTGLSFTISTSSRQRSHSWVRVPLDSWPYVAVSDLRLPQPGGLGPRIYIPHEQGGPVIPPGTQFLLRLLQQLSGLRCRYSKPPLHEIDSTTTQKDKVILRPTVSRPVYLGVDPPPGVQEQIFATALVLSPFYKLLLYSTCVSPPIEILSGWNIVQSCATLIRNGMSRGIENLKILP
jgi:hypothetical protein